MMKEGCFMKQNCHANISLLFVDSVIIFYFYGQRCVDPNELPNRSGIFLQPLMEHKHDYYCQLALLIYGRFCSVLVKYINICVCMCVLCMCVCVCLVFADVFLCVCV